MAGSAATASDAQELLARVAGWDGWWSVREAARRSEGWPVARAGGRGGGRCWCTLVGALWRIRSHWEEEQRKKKKKKLEKKEQARGKRREYKKKKIENKKKIWKMKKKKGKMLENSKKIGKKI